MKCYWSKNWTILVCLLIVQINGCGGDGDMENVYKDTNISKIGRSISIIRDASWFGGNFIDMGPTYDRACFVTGVWGAFDGDWVGLYITNSGRWILGGSNSNVGVWASCVSTTNTEGPNFWTSGWDGWRDLGDRSNNRVCFLNQIGGRLRGFDEWVNTGLFNDNRWRLDSGATGDEYADGESTCITGFDFNWESTIHRNDFRYDPYSIDIGPMIRDGRPRRCFIKQVRGSMENHQLAFINYNDPPGRITLYNDIPDGFVEARCIW